jgi:hypothetical protein
VPYVPPVSKKRPLRFLLVTKVKKNAFDIGQERVEEHNKKAPVAKKILQTWGFPLYLNSDNCQNVIS